MSSNLPKDQTEILKKIVCFLVDLKAPKGHFEINLLLVSCENVKIRMHLQKLVQPIVLVTIKFRSNVIMSTHCCPVHLEKLRPQFHEKIHSCAKEILLMNSKIKSIYEHFFALHTAICKQFT